MIANGTAAWIGAAVLLVLSPSLPAQGPVSGFSVPEGEIAIAPAYGVEGYGAYFGAGGTVENRDVTTTSYSIFLEAGLNELTSLIATLPYLRTNERSGSLQDASLWIKYRNLDERTVAGVHRFFTAVGLSFPVGRYETTGIAALGQRATVFQPRLVYQYQFDGGFFVHAQSGIDIQFAPESRSSWPLLLRGGYGSQAYYLEAWVEFVTSLRAGTAVQTAVAGTGSSWRRTGGTLYLPLRDWVGVTASVAFVLGGEFIGRSTRFGTGLVFKINPKQSR